MHPLFHFLRKWKCRSLFDTLALDALRGLTGERATAWQSQFLWRIDPYFEGVAAPPVEFRDFANHSFDPDEPSGAAARLATKWFDQTRAAFQAGDCQEGTAAAGTLMRYCAFSLLLLHGHHREPGLSRRGLLAWCLEAHDETLLAAAGDDDEVRAAVWRGDSLEEYLAEQSRAARRDESLVLSRLTPDLYGSDPPSLPEDIVPVLGRHLTIVRETLGIVLERALLESGAIPRRKPVTLAALAGYGTIPVFWIARTQARLSARRERRGIHREWVGTGHFREAARPEMIALRDAYAIDHGFAPDDNLERDAEAREMPPSPQTSNGIPFSIARVGVAPVASFEPLSSARSLQEVFSLDGKTAEAFRAAGVVSIGDLLEVDPGRLSDVLPSSVTVGEVNEWRQSAALCLEIPLLSIEEAQLLVACGVCDRRDLASLGAVELWELVIPVAESPDGERLLGRREAPGLDTITEWIEAARLKAA